MKLVIVADLALADLEINVNQADHARLLTFRAGRKTPKGRGHHRFS
jgi:hypothetical protein